MNTEDAPVKKAGLLDQHGPVSPGGSDWTQTVIGQQQMNQESIYQTNRRDFLTSQGQSNLYSSGQFGQYGQYGQYGQFGQHGGSMYTDTAFVKQSQLTALNTWKTNGLYLDKVNPRREKPLLLFFFVRIIMTMDY